MNAVPKSFLECLHASGLVGSEAIQRVLETVPSKVGDLARAAYFIEAELLTPYQAERLLRRTCACCPRT